MTAKEAKWRRIKPRTAKQSSPNPVLYRNFQQLQSVKIFISYFTKYSGVVCLDQLLGGSIFSWHMESRGAMEEK